MNRITKYFLSKNNMLVGAAIIVMIMTGCEKYVIESTEINPDDTRSFATDILPIFAKNGCTACHGGGIKPDLRPDKAYDALISGGFINTDKPKSSKLYNQLVNKASHQPKTSVDEEKYILYWITQGAENN